jgi:hypothetical protein
MLGSRAAPGDPAPLAGRIRIGMKPADLVALAGEPEARETVHEKSPRIQFWTYPEQTSDKVYVGLVNDHVFTIYLDSQLAPVRAQSRDALAKADLHNAATAMEALRPKNMSSYRGLTVSRLVSEGSLRPSQDVNLEILAADEAAYRLKATITGGTAPGFLFDSATGAITPIPGEPPPGPTTGWFQRSSELFSAREPRASSADLYLEFLAQVTNESLPRAIDEMTELVRVTAVRRQLIYDYVVKHPQDELRALLPSVKTMIRDANCKDPTIEYLWRDGIRLRHNYRTKKGGPAESFTITAKDCGYWLPAL